MECFFLSWQKNICNSVLLSFCFLPTTLSYVSEPVSSHDTTWFLNSFPSCYILSQTSAISLGFSILHVGLSPELWYHLLFHLKDKKFCLFCSFHVLNCIIKKCSQKSQPYEYHSLLLASYNQPTSGNIFSSLLPALHIRNTNFLHNGISSTENSTPTSESIPLWYKCNPPVQLKCHVVINHRRKHQD